MDLKNPIGWVEIPVRNIMRAKGFYEETFNMSLRLDEMNGYKMAFFPEMVEEHYGVTGALIEGKNYTPSHSGALVYFSVPEIETALKTINSNGGKILSSKKSIGENGFIATFEDCEGNRLAVHSMS